MPGWNEAKVGHRRANCKRQREWRARQRDGLAIYPVLATDAVLNMLIDLRWVDEEKSDDRKQVGQAITALLDDAARHHKKIA